MLVCRCVKDSQIHSHSNLSPELHISNSSFLKRAAELLTRWITPESFLCTFLLTVVDLDISKLET